ncbi:MAG TPA: hypothetical protein VFJ85_09360 [Acidimicrobiales bacterium]|nr:hypothetical protein [Acidimicrobiales bacterium]
MTVFSKEPLQKLQDDIDEVRRRADIAPDQEERAFLDEGEADRDQPVDDTIAPPG